MITALNNLKKFFSILLPKTKYEYFILFFFLILYFILASYITCTTDIIDKQPRIQYNFILDMYFSFDNACCIYEGTIGHEKHPLTFYLYYPFKILYEKFIFHNINTKIFTLLITFQCSFFISYSNMIIFKYLKNIINLKLLFSFIITFSYGFFGCNLILSFTPETYTLSLILLTIHIYVVSIYIYNKKAVNTLYYIVSGILIGGQTITNAPKVVFPIFFEKKLSFKNLILSLLKCIVIAFFASIFILIRWRWSLKSYFEDLTNTGFYFMDYPIWNYFISYFLGANILFPSMRIDNSEWHWIKNKGIYLNFYDQWFQYAFIIIIFSLIIYGIIKNYNNKLIWLLILLFLYDICLHFVIKVGVNESFIYGGHFVYVYPLLLGWTLKSFKEKHQKYLSLFILFLGLILLINNGYRMWQFIEMAQLLYPCN